MDRPTFPLSRWPWGLFAAVIVATGGTALLAITLPQIARSSFSALPHNLVLASLFFGIAVLPLAVLMGAVGALLCLAPVFILAARLRMRLPGYMLAGMLAGLGHTLLMVPLRIWEAPNFPGTSRFWWLGIALVSPHPDFQNTYPVGLAAMGAGAAAGALFATIVLPHDVRGSPGRSARHVLLFAALATMLATWWVAHDREGDSDLCPHTDQVRVIVATTNYALPAVLRPQLIDAPGERALHIFKGFDHMGSRAERLAKNAYVYCQTAQDKA